MFYLECTHQVYKQEGTERRARVTYMEDCPIVAVWLMDSETVVERHLYGDIMLAQEQVERWLS